MIRFSENSFSSSLSPLKDFKTIDHTKMDEKNLKSMWENIYNKIIALPDDNPFPKEYQLKSIWEDIKLKILALPDDTQYGREY